MVNPDIALSPLFAVPCGSMRLADCAALNRELEALFLARENDEYRNPTPSHVPQRETFESRFNLFRWPEPCVQELRRLMLDAVVSMVLKTTTMRREGLAALTLNNHTWFHISRFGGGFIAHNHPLASWSAVYCVRSGEAPGRGSAGGVLRFFDPRGAADAYCDPAVAGLHRAFSPKPVDVRSVPGQLIVFPSYLFHEVTPYYGPDARITVATNVWFT